MTVDQPQEQHGEAGHSERVERERDVGAAREAERLEEQPEEPEHPARVEDETDAAPVQEQDRPWRVENERDDGAAHERDHPELFEDERDGAAAQEAERPAATASAMPGGEGEMPALMTGVQGTVLEDRDTGPSHSPAQTPTSAHGDFQVFDPGELKGYRSRWE